MLGGENQRGSIIHDTGYSEKAQCTGNQRSYLEPITNSMHEPIEGVYRVTKKIEDRSRIGCRVNQKQRRRLIKREGVSNREQQNTESAYNQRPTSTTNTNSNQNRSTTQKYLDSSNGLVNEPCNRQNSPRENSCPLTRANARAAESANTHAHLKKAKQSGTL